MGMSDFLSLLAVPRNIDNSFRQCEQRSASGAVSSFRINKRSPYLLNRDSVSVNCQLWRRGVRVGFNGQACIVGSAEPRQLFHLSGRSWWGVHVHISLHELNNTSSMIRLDFFIIQLRAQET